VPKWIKESVSAVPTKNRLVRLFCNPSTAPLENEGIDLGRYKTILFVCGGEEALTAGMISVAF